MRIFNPLITVAVVLLIPSLPTVTTGEEEEAGEDTMIEEERKETKEVVVIETRLGRIVLDFFPEDAPNHVANFKKLASEGFYDGTTFHRVIPGFIIQGGNPKSKDADRSNDGTGGGPGYTIDAEFNSKKHIRGTLSMARAADNPNSAGSQFFICVARQPSLDDKYTIFGEVIEGMDVVDKIVDLERDERDNPIEPVVMQKVFIETRDK